MKAICTGVLVAVLAIATTAQGVDITYTVSSNAAGQTYTLGQAEFITWSVDVSVPDDASNAGVAQWGGEIQLLKDSVLLPMTLPLTLNSAGNNSMYARVFRVGGSAARAVNQPSSTGGVLIGGPGLTFDDDNAPYNVDQGKLYGFGSAYAGNWDAFGSDEFGDPKGSMVAGVGLNSAKATLLGTGTRYTLIQATSGTGFDNRISVAGLPLGNYTLRFVPKEGEQAVLQPGIDYATYADAVPTLAATGVGGEISFVVVPEPATMLLLGIPALFLRRRHA